MTHGEYSHAFCMANGLCVSDHRHSIVCHNLTAYLAARPREAPKPDPKVLEVIQDVCKAYVGTTVQDVLGDARHSQSRRARGHAMDVLNRAGMSYSSIGRAFGRTFGTVASNLRTYRQSGTGLPPLDCERLYMSTDEIESMPTPSRQPTQLP